MVKDQKVFFIGEDVGAAGGVFKATVVKEMEFLFVSFESDCKISDFTSFKTKGKFIIRLIKKMS